MKILLATITFGLASAGSFSPGSPATVEPPPGPAAPRYALAVGTLVLPKGKAARSEGPGTEMRNGTLEWWLIDGDGGQPRRLIDPLAGRVAVAPIDRTIPLFKTPNAITLLGPDGKDLVLSLKEGPLADATIHPSNRTTFSFSPDGGTLAFANRAEELCRIRLADRTLLRTPMPGISLAEGVRYRRDGRRIAYARYARANHGKVYAADPDGRNERELGRLEYLAELGFDFLPDGRVGVVGLDGVTAYDADTGKSERVAGPWPSKVTGRNFGGFHPDGSSFLFDTGGPYILNLHRTETRSGMTRLVKGEYSESFEEMAWVRLLPSQPKPSP
jgi:hypothetical protein